MYIDFEFKQSMITAEYKDIGILKQKNQNV